MGDFIPSAAKAGWVWVVWMLMYGLKPVPFS